MCGIVGFWGDGPADEQVAERMARRLAHRGPNDSGTYVDGTAGLAFGHRRLSILDLSSAGHQPMQSPCGRFVLTYNGEIYNHKEIRRELEKDGTAFAWRGQSDTETLLAGLRRWGAEACLRKINGMFAFALWDKVDRTLVLARDRFGEKPLYFGVVGGVFMFASELAALKVHPSWGEQIDRDALTLFFRFGYVPSPRSIYVGIGKLPAASYLVVRDRGREMGQPRNYWDLRRIAEGSSQAKYEDLAYCEEQLASILDESVRSRMAADVPLGAFLSGGYDSTAVVSAMQRNSSNPVRTFSMGFEFSDFNEAPFAKAVAKHLGTTHSELYVTAADALQMIPKLPTIFSEPFADSSQIPTYLISCLARRDVTVVLSGDGGDELFGGYNRYSLGHKIWSASRLVPNSGRLLLARALGSGWANSSIDKLQGKLPQRLQVKIIKDRLLKLSEVLRFTENALFYEGLVSQWKDAEDVVLGGARASTSFNSQESWPVGLDFRETMMFLDQMSYLPDDILAKVDRATMAASLEARVPFLDYRLVEFAWRLPIRMKFRGLVGKWILREHVHRYVPKHIMNRPKMGFGVPIEQWLRGPLRTWANDLLDPRRLNSEGFVDPKRVVGTLDEHLSGGGRRHYQIWTALMFQAWLDAQRQPVADYRGLPITVVTKPETLERSTAAETDRRESPPGSQDAELRSKRLGGVDVATKRPSRIKVLHVITGLNRGGAERALSSQISGSSQERVEAMVLSLRGRGAYGDHIERSGVSVISLDMTSLFSMLDVRVFASAISAIRAFHPDIIHGWMYHGCVVATALRATLRPRPTIMWNVRASLYRIEQHKMLTRMVVKLCRRLSGFPDMIFYNSFLSALQHERFGFSGEKRIVVGNGFDTNLFRPDAGDYERLRNVLGIPSESLIVGHFARFHPQKDHKSFLKAASTLVATNDRLHVVMAGRGVEDGNSEIERLVPEGLRARFHLLGELESAHIEMRGIDIFCMSSAFGEGFPNVVGEAMATGIPCIVTDVGDAASVVGECGIVVPSNNVDRLMIALSNLLELTPVQRRELGDAGRRRVMSEFSLAANVAKYETIYDNALRESPARGN